MRIRWTPAAAADLQHINDYLKDHHPHYRQPTMRKLYEAIGSLKLLPHRGRPGRENGTREILFPPMPYQSWPTTQVSGRPCDQHSPWLAPHEQGKHVVVFPA